MKKLILTALLLTGLAFGFGKANAQEAKNNHLIIDETATEQVEEEGNSRFFGGVGTIYKTWINGISPTFTLGLETKHLGVEFFYIPPIEHSKFFNELSYWDDDLDSTLVERGVLTSKLSTIGWTVPFGSEKFKVGFSGAYCWGKETADLIDTKRKLDCPRSYIIPALTVKSKLSEKIGLNLRYSFDGPEPMDGPEFTAELTTPVYNANKFLASIEKFMTDASYENSWVSVGTVYKNWAGGASPTISLGEENKHLGFELCFTPGIKSSKHYSEIIWPDMAGSEDSLKKVDGVLTSKINSFEFINPYIGWPNFKIGASLVLCWGDQEVYRTDTKETITIPQAYSTLNFKAKAKISEKIGLNWRFGYDGNFGVGGPEFGAGLIFYFNK